MRSTLKKSIEKLSMEFAHMKWSHFDFVSGETKNMLSLWPGNPNDDIIICVLKTNHIDEPFHMQDFFFLNYAYSGNCRVLSVKTDNEIVIAEDECYIGQPASGYALKGYDNKDIVVFGVLIQKELFFHEYLPLLSGNFSLLSFFLAPQTDRFSEQFIHLSFGKHSPVRTILEIMVEEYARRQEDTQTVLKPMALTLFMYVAREYRENQSQKLEVSTIERIVQYISDHPESASLGDIAARFSYHPNYISSMLHEKTGKTFSQIVLEQRMERAMILLRGTTLTIEEIASMLGYSNSSNFYKAFRERYHVSPRECVCRSDLAPHG